jgi:tetratricopeptide (TPR) repeat protein
MKFGKHLACFAVALLPSSFVARASERIVSPAVDTQSADLTAASQFSSSALLLAPLAALLIPKIASPDIRSAHSGSSSTHSASSQAATSGESAQQHWERGQTLAKAGDLEDATHEFEEAARIAPNNPRYLSSLGAVLAQQQKFEEAVGYFERAHKADPANVPVLQNLAAAQWQLGKLPDAETNLRQVRRLNPGNQEATLMLGMVLENQGQYAPAEKLLQSVPDRVSVHPEARAALLHCYYETGHLSDAHRLEDEVLADAKDVQAAFLCATVAVRERDFPPAERLLAAIRDLYPEPAEVEYQLALARYGAARYADAEQILRQLIEKDGEKGQYFNLLGWCLAKEGKIAESVNAFDRSIDIDPRDVSNYVDLATVLMDAGQLPAALEAATKAVSVDANSYAAQRIAGQIQTRQHNYEAALQSYTRAAQLNRDDADAWLDLAAAQDAAGRRNDAAATLAGAIKKFPRAAQLYYRYALILLYPPDPDDHAKELKAVALLRKALSSDDSIAGAHYELGNILLREDQSSKALGELRAAEKLDPGDSNTHYALWTVLRKLGQTQEAQNELQIFQKLKSQEGNAQP